MCLKKRPCRICRRWFRPSNRGGHAQKACSPECRKAWHKKKCKEWRRKNRSCLIEDRVQKVKDGICPNIKTMVAEDLIYLIAPVREVMAPESAAIIAVILKVVEKALREAKPIHTIETKGVPP